jgi:uncharacterized membrane protein
MNVALWIVQVLLALAFLLVGVNHAFRVEQTIAQGRPGMMWVAAVPRWLMTFIGVCEILGAVGQILPPLTNILPWLTPLAALLLAIMMVLAIGFHLRRREYPNLIINIILLALAAFVAYGRFVLVPF